MTKIFRILMAAIILSLASCGHDNGDNLQPEPTPPTVANKSKHLQIRMHDFPLLDHEVEKVVVEIQ